MSDIQIKICGVKDKEIAKHAVDAGANFVGFIFYEKSHRNITVENCKQILSDIKDLTIPVAVTVNPDDKLLDDLSRIGFHYIQLHGQETLEIVKKIKLNYDFKIIKAFGISSPEDLDELINILISKPFFSIDTETSSLYPLEAVLVGISFSYDPNEAYYIPIGHKLSLIHI